MKSFINVEKNSHFPLENLPFGIFKPRGGAARVGVALGEDVVDLSVLDVGEDRQVFAQDSLNAFLALGRPAWRKVRETLQHLLAADTPTLRDDVDLRGRVFHKQSEVTLQLPARIGDYTDFYSSYH
ncbi:MAG: fumarylacetoacetase, partial [Spartobacteria bacterium]